MESVAVGMALVGVDGRALTPSGPDPAARTKGRRPHLTLAFFTTAPMAWSARRIPRPCPSSSERVRNRLDNECHKQLKSLMPRGVVELRGIEPLTSSLR